MSNFETLIIHALQDQRDRLANDPSAQVLLKMLVEIRESARKNDDLETYDRISEKLKELGIELSEETHVTARITAD